MDEKEKARQRLKELRAAKSRLGEIRGSKESKGSKIKEFGKTIARETARPFARGALNIQRISQAIKGASREELAQPKESQFFGELTPIGVEGSLKTRLKDTTGAGFKIASNIPFFRGTAAIAKQGFFRTVGQSIKTGAREGVIGGGLFGAGEGLEQDKSALGIAADTALGAGLGGGGGGLFGGALATTGKTLNKFSRGTLAEDVGKTLQGKATAPTGPSTPVSLAKQGLSTQEIESGIRPAIKKRIQSNPSLLDKFFKQSRDNNLDDTALTPQGLASQMTERAFKKIEATINDTGTKIGKFRKKLAGVKVAATEIDSAIGAFDNSIAKKGLGVTGERKLKVAKGRETVFSPREIVELQNMRDSLVRLKGDPTIIRVIDNRNAIQKNITFGKAQREISSEVDIVAKSVRSKLKEINARTIGTSEARNLSEFSSLVETLDEFKALSSKGRNFEFLVRRVLSGRDKLPKEVIPKIKEITGVDLMDVATFSNLSTEILGNANQKGLFRQEITNAGLDAVDILSSGGKLGIIRKTLKEGADEFTKRVRGIDPDVLSREETAEAFMRSARGEFDIPSNVRSAVSSVGQFLEEKIAPLEKSISFNPKGGGSIQSVLDTPQVRQLRQSRSAMGERLDLAILEGNSTVERRLRKALEQIDGELVKLVRSLKR